MSDQEIDPETLQAEVEQIKEAMGLQERYPSAFRLWLLFGVLVLGASLVSQYVYLQELPGYWYPVVWVAFLSPAWLYQWWRGRRSGWRQPSDAKPNAFRQSAAVFSLYVVLLFVLAPVEGLELTSLQIFAFSVGLIGASYLVSGESLKAYNIRRKDRWAFYVGGAWMLVFAMATPNVEVLVDWGFAAYGALYAVHSVGSYLALRE